MPLRADKTLLTQQEAAQRLNVNQSTISRLLTSNMLEPATRNNGRNTYVTAESVIRYSRQHHGGGRPMSPDMAMGLLCMLDGWDADWLTSMQRHRIRGRLQTSSPDELAWIVRNRARTMRVYAFPPNLPTLRSQALDGGVTDEKVSLKFGLASKKDVLECYMSETMINGFLADWTVRETDTSNMIVHVVSDRMFTLIKEHGGIPLAACAVDLMESADPREYATGLEQLESMIEEWRNRS